MRTIESKKKDSKKIYILSDTHIDGAINFPVISIEFLTPSFHFESCNAFIFTSKNSVIALNSLYPDWKKYPSFAIGGSTAKIIESLGGRVSFCLEKSYGNILADEIHKKFASLKFLYPRPKIVAFDIAAELRSCNINVEELVVYQTLCAKKLDYKPEDGAIIVFSSPSTVECFFKNYQWMDSYKAVAIGKTTASVIPKNVVMAISNEQNLHAAVELAQTL